MSKKSRNIGGLCAFASMLCISQSFAQPPITEGLVEYSGEAVARKALSQDQIYSFMPDRGLFRFPAPYNTLGVRITNASDCAGNDCVNYAGYAYWRNMNNHVGNESMLVFLGLDRNRGGRGPSLYELNKNTGDLNDLGALFPESHRLSWATGEGWYFSATMPTKLYLNDGAKLVRFDVITEQMDTVFDVTEHMGSGYYVTQLHSSDNDRIHSATVRNSTNYQVQGCIAYDEAARRYHYYPIKKDFDECQVDRSGEFLIIKANIDGINGEDNLIVNLRTGEERLLLDRDGAGGHSDVGHGYMIAADNWANDANTWKVWDLTKSTLKGERVYHNNDWNIFAPAHISHTNARPDLPAKNQYACGSSVNRIDSVHANEVICFNLDGSGTTVAVAPTMTNLDAAGGGNDYARLPKGNLDVTGKYFLWTSNLDGNRLDMFVVQVPDHLLTGVINNAVEQVDDNAPEQNKVMNPMPVTISPLTVPVVWHELLNATASQNGLSKTTGCDGCADSGAISAQVAARSFARMDFTAETTGPLLVAGFNRSQTVPSARSLEFAIRLQGGIAEVREFGVYRADIAFNKGDRFSIDVKHGRVEYSRNQQVFYISSLEPTHALYAGVGLLGLGGTLSNIIFEAD